MVICVWWRVCVLVCVCVCVSGGGFMGCFCVHENRCLYVGKINTYYRNYLHMYPHW